MTKTDDFLFKLLLGVILAGTILAFTNPGQAQNPRPAYAAATAAKSPSTLIGGMIAP